jgi:pimeloyl-ACP methyl ester carboxylesterase
MSDAAPPPFERALTRLIYGAGKLTQPLFGGRYGQVPPELPKPEEVEVAVAGRPVYLHRWPGQGTPWLLLHGLNNSAWVWARVAQLLSRARPVFAPSLRGHGRASRPEDDWSLAATTADLLALFEHLGLTRAHLAGHSWGGKVATHFAISHPERLASLTVADPVPPGGLPRWMRALPVIPRAALAMERGPFADEDAWHAGRRAIVHLRADDDTDRRCWAEEFRRAADGSYQHVLPDAAYRQILEHTLQEDLRPELGRVRCPVHFLLPDQAVNVSRRYVRPYEQAAGPFTLTRVSGEHAFVHSNPMDTADAMERWLRALRPAC